MNPKFFGDFLDHLPEWMLPVVVFFSMFAVWEFVKFKYLTPKNGNGPLKELQASVENHLTTAVKELGMDIRANTQALRDMQEQDNRVAHTCNVILTKMDAMRDLIIEVRAKVNGR